MVFVVFTGIWAIITGLILLAAYYQMRSIYPRRSNFPFLSVLSLLIGILLLLNPFGSAVIIVVLMGVFAIVFGILSMFNTLRPVSQ